MKACKGCGIPWGAPNAQGQCRTCRRCLECCGKDEVAKSCADRWNHMSDGQRVRSVRGYDAYWRSYEAGKQKR